MFSGKFFGECTRDELEMKSDQIVGDVWLVKEDDGSKSIQIWWNGEWKPADDVLGTDKQIEELVKGNPQCQEEPEVLHKVCRIKDLLDVLDNYKGSSNDTLTVWDPTSGERYPIISIDTSLDGHIEFDFECDWNCVEIEELKEELEDDVLYKVIWNPDTDPENGLPIDIIKYTGDCAKVEDDKVMEILETDFCPYKYYIYAKNEKDLKNAVYKLRNKVLTEISEKIAHERKYFNNCQKFFDKFDSNKFVYAEGEVLTHEE